MEKTTLTMESVVLEVPDRLVDRRAVAELRRRPGD